MKLFCSSSPFSPGTGYGVVTNCNTVRAPGYNAGTETHGVSGDMRGLAAKELSGPTLLTVPRCARKRC